MTANIFPYNVNGTLSEMAPHKFVVKCGNFAVLVDLHALAPGALQDSWITAELKEEVAGLIRDAVEQRVRLFTESYHRGRGQSKQKRELAPSVPLCVRGTGLSLIANFVKRHFNLRCIVKERYGELRVFPERYVVCASRPEDAAALHGNPSQAATELSEQSKSEYFSRPGETQEPLNSSTITKRTALQKIARQAHTQRLGPREQLPILGEERPSPGKERPIVGEERPSPGEERCSPEVTYPGQWTTEAVPQVAMVPCSKPNLRTGGRRRREPGSPEEDLQPRRAKRACLGGPPVPSAGELITQTPSAESSSPASEDDPPLPPPPPPLPPLPPVGARAKAESKAFPAPEHTETTLEVELLTPGKRAERLPLASNNTEQTNQNRLAASLRGLSVKPASSGSSIGSRSRGREEGSENAPRTSRLRRAKRS